LAFSGAYEPARLLCRKVLAGSPNYHDVQVLYGRMFAWEKNHKEAVEAFAEVLRRNPEYEDAYLAWIDAATWAGKKDSALLLSRKALSGKPSG
jgi:tetratricopeptide (TPR) repeat protein